MLTVSDRAPRSPATCIVSCRLALAPDLHVIQIRSDIDLPPFSGRDCCTMREPGPTIGVRSTEPKLGSCHAGTPTIRPENPPSQGTTSLRGSSSEKLAEIKNLKAKVCQCREEDNDIRRRASVLFAEDPDPRDPSSQRSTISIQEVGL